jgi:hypothetical protein
MWYTRPYFRTPGVLRARESDLEVPIAFIYRLPAYAERHSGNFENGLLAAVGLGGEFQICGDNMQHGVYIKVTVWGRLVESGQPYGDVGRRKRR